MRLIAGNCENNQGRYIGAWWQQHSGHSIYAPYSCIGINESEQLIGALIFTNYTGSSVELHAHLECPITNRLMKYIANYVFNELKCNVLRALPHHNNIKVCKLLERIGFEREAELKQFYAADIHAISYKFTIK